MKSYVHKSDKTDKNLLIENELSSFNFISHILSRDRFISPPPEIRRRRGSHPLIQSSSNARIVIQHCSTKRLNDSSKVTWWRVRFTNERTRIRMRVTHTHPSKTCFTLVARNLDASLNTWLVIIICRTWHSSFRVDVHYIGVTANWKFPRFWCWYVDESCIRRGICFDVWFWFFSVLSEYLNNVLTEGLVLYIVHNEIIRNVWSLNTNKLYKIMEEDYYDICKKNGGTRSMILIIGRKLGRKYEKERPIGTNFKPINIDISRLLPKPCLSISELDYIWTYIHVKIS